MTSPAHLGRGKRHGVFESHPGRQFCCSAYKSRHSIDLRRVGGVLLARVVEGFAVCPPTFYYYEAWVDNGLVAIRIMKKVFAAALLFLYAFSSSGIVLVEFSCRGSGASGVSVPEPRECYAPFCGDEVSGEATPCDEVGCCDTGLRIVAPEDQLATRHGPNGDRAEEPVQWLAVVAGLDVVELAPLRRVPHPPFVGFDRPIRI